MPSLWVLFNSGEDETKIVKFLRTSTKENATSLQKVETKTKVKSSLSDFVICVYKLEEACTANEGPVRIQYKCLVPIYPYVFPGMKLCGLVISKTEL